MQTNHNSNCPYRGLMPYTEADARFFFGRDTDRQIVIANLHASRLTILYGASGVGKSSLLQAGVAFHLHQQPGQAVIIFNNWHTDPVAGLKQAVMIEIGRLLERQIVQTEDLPLDKFLQNQAQGLRLPLMIILDQFEEFFLYNRQVDDPRSFPAEFARSVNQSDCPVNFLISIREDTLSKLDLFERRIPGLFNNYLRINHLDQNAAREAIIQPLNVYNQEHSPDQQIKPEEHLITTIIEQVRKDKILIGQVGQGRIEPAMGDRLGKEDVRIETAYLQLVLTRLWEEEVRRNSQILRLTTLKALGGAEKIVREYLDMVMGSLGPDQKEIAARIFGYLVTPSGTKIAYTVTDLASYAETTTDRIQTMIGCLAEQRVLRPVASGVNEIAEPRYEIYHDVLAQAVLDWRTRYESRVATPEKVTLPAIYLTLAITVLQYLLFPQLPSSILLIIRGLALIILNMAVLLQVYRAFYRQVRQRVLILPLAGLDGTNLGILLSLLLTILWYVLTGWPSGADPQNPLGTIKPDQFIAYLLIVMPTLLFGTITFVAMRNFGQLTYRLLRRFDFGFYGVYFGACAMIIALIILGLLGILPEKFRITF